MQTQPSWLHGFSGCILMIFCDVKSTVAQKCTRFGPQLNPDSDSPTWVWLWFWFSNLILICLWFNSYLDLGLLQLCKWSLINVILIGLSIKGPVAIGNILMPPRLIKIARRGPQNQLTIANWILKKLINLFKKAPSGCNCQLGILNGRCMPTKWKSPLLVLAKQAINNVRC